MPKYYVFVFVSFVFFNCKTKTPVVKKGFIPIEESTLIEEISEDEITLQPQIFMNTSHGGEVKIIHTIENTGFHSYNGLAFQTENKGILVGGSRLRIRTTLDGGTNWREIKLSRFADAFHSVAFSKDNAYVVGECSFIGKSDADLENWKVYDFTQLEGLDGDSHKLYKIKFLGQLGFAMGFDTGFGISKPLILKTTDGGTNWSVIKHSGLQAETGAINDFEIINEDILYIVTQLGNSYKSSDGGMTWGTIFTPTEKYTNLNSIAFKNESTGFISGISGRLYFTNDAGQNWKQNMIFKDSTDLNISDIKYLTDDMIAITTSQSFVDEERPVFTYLLNGNGENQMPQALLTKQDSTLFFEGDAFNMFLLNKKRLFISDRNNVYVLDTKELSLD